MTMNTIKIYHDHHAENPRTSRDSEPPLITRWGKDFEDNEYWIDIVDFIRSKLNHKNMYAIAQVLWYSREDIEKEKSYYSDKKSIKVIEDYIYDELVDVEAIESILNILKVKNYRWTSIWYSQWDCIDCILIATDEWIKYTGINKKDIQQSLRESSKLFDSRTWWDVYWYKVVKYNDLYHKNWEIAKEKNEEEIDSCWWFYWDEGIEQILENTKQYWITKEMIEESMEDIIY